MCLILNNYIALFVTKILYIIHNLFILFNIISKIVIMQNEKMSWSRNTL